MHKGKLTNVNPPRITTEPIFVKLDFANSVAFLKAFEKAINMYHTSLFFNCFVKTGWHEDMERNVKFGGFFEGLVEKP